MKLVLLKKVVKVLSVSIPLWVMALVVLASGIKYLTITTEINSLYRIIESNESRISRLSADLTICNSNNLILKSSIKDQNDAIDEMNLRYELSLKEMTSRIESADELLLDRESRLNELNSSINIGESCEESNQWLRDRSRSVSQW